MSENLTYDETTLHKVYNALRETGLPDQQVTDAVSLMQNAGILFRERVDAECVPGWCGACGRKMPTARRP